MRTDGVQIVPEAVKDIRSQVEKAYGNSYLPPFIREYKTKAKNAQEAHEAIRPTDVTRKPSDVARYLEKDQARLYELIWKRAVASQMASAELEQTAADIEVSGRDGKTYSLRASGSVVKFDGFLKVYEEGRDERQHASKGKDDQADAEDASRRLPALAEGDHVNDKAIEPEQHSRSRRHASPKRHWSRNWRSWASAARRHTLPRLLCCKSGITYASIRSA